MDQQPKPLDLDAIEQRAAKATPGPWWNDNFEIYTSEHVGIPAMCTWIGETCTVDLPDHGDTNGAFIANAREDVPAMAAEIRRLTAELAKYVGHEPTIAEEMAYLQTENDRLTTELDLARTVPAAMRRQITNEIRAYCPDHGTADTGRIKCHCEIADELDRRYPAPAATQES